MTRLRRIVLIGGGLGGLAAAIALCRKEFEVNVYEQASALGEVGAGINVGPNGVKAFRYLGLEADLNQIGFVPTGRANRHLRTGRLIHTIPLRNIVERFGAQFILTHRADLLELLARRVQESSLHLGYRCVGVDQSGDSAVATFENGKTVEGDVIIGCDGIRSTVRSCLFGDEPARYTGNLCWRSIVPAEALSPGLMDSNITNWYGQGAHVTAYYIRQGTAYNFVAVREVPDWTEESWVVPSSKSELLSAFPEAETNLVTLFERADLVTKWGQFDREPSEQWTVGRITLLGDAAHPMLPSLGQGAATAFEDACVLAELADKWRDDPTGALVRYEAARKPRTSKIQISSSIESRAKKVSTLSMRMQRKFEDAVARLLNYRNKTTNHDWIYRYDPAKDWVADVTPRS